MLRVLKVFVRVLLLLVAVVAASLYLLYFRRAPLPAAAPHARVAPAISTIPGVAACWVETGKTFSNFSFGSTAGSVLVRHPAGDLLIDTGNSSRFDEEIRGYPFWLRIKLKSLAGELNPKVPLPELLRRIGEDPAKVRWAILSHVHLDHAGGLMDLPPLPVLLTREELAVCERSESAGQRIHDRRAHPEISAAFRAHSRVPCEAVRNVRRERRPLQGRSVVVVPLRGHTPGSVGVFVNLSPARRMFYVGDAVDDERGFEERVGKSLILQDSDNDKALADQVVGRLSELHEKVPGLAIIPAHGRSAYKKFFPGGPLSCVSGQQAQ